MKDILELTDDELIALLANHTTIAAAARSYGVCRKRLHWLVNKRGIRKVVTWKRSEMVDNLNSPPEVEDE